MSEISRAFSEACAGAERAFKEPNSSGPAADANILDEAKARAVTFVVASAAACVERLDAAAALAAPTADADGGADLSRCLAGMGAASVTRACTLSAEVLESSVIVEAASRMVQAFLRSVVALLRLGSRPLVGDVCKVCAVAIVHSFPQPLMNLLLLRVRRIVVVALHSQV